MIDIESITLKDIEKEVALMKHRNAYKDKDTYNLPYRIMFDYWESDYNNNVHINRYYPFDEVPEQGKWDFRTDGHYTPDEWFRLKIQIIDGKKCVPDIGYVPPQIQALIDEKGKPYRLWDLDTAAGQQAWVYYFMVFIMPYKEQIPLFDVFSMYGDTKHSTEELKRRIAYYMDLITKCEEQPELYKHDIQTKGNTPLDLLYSERDMIPNYEKVCTDINHRAYRISEAIRLLEQDTTTPAADE